MMPIERVLKEGTVPQNQPPRELYKVTILYEDIFDDGENSRTVEQIYLSDSLAKVKISVEDEMERQKRIRKLDAFRVRITKANFFEIKKGLEKFAESIIVAEGYFADYCGRVENSWSGETKWKIKKVD